MRFSDFIEYLVWSLYVRERQEAPSGAEFLDLSKSVVVLDDPVPQQWVWDASSVLETRGLIRAIHAMGGFSAAALTGQGRLYVEAELTKPTGVIGTRFAPDRELVARLEAIHEGGPPTREEQTAPIRELVGQLARAVDQMALPELEKADLLADVRTIEIQLAKAIPNIDVIGALLESLARFTELSAIASQITQLLYPGP
ncbi:MAG TPA: hypothetical protein VKR27_07595 [Acidimicrobiales bacterium]|nr:hypothetical protein [Acidimicrobiales bacterium]